MIGQVSIAAATAVVGYDLFKDQTWNVSGRNRVIRGLACAGSAAAGDTEVDLYVGNVRVTNFFNSATGFPTRDHYKPLGAVAVPAGTKISAIVRDAPATNPINIDLY